MSDTLFDPTRAPEVQAVAEVLARHGADGRAVHCMPDLGWDMAADLANVTLTPGQRSAVCDLLHQEHRAFMQAAATNPGLASVAAAVNALTERETP